MRYSAAGIADAAGMQTVAKVAGLSVETTEKLLTLVGLCEIYIMCFLVCLLALMRL